MVEQELVELLGFGGAPHGDFAAVGGGFGRLRGGERVRCFDRAGTPVLPEEYAARHPERQALEGRRGGGCGLDQGREFLGNSGGDDRSVSWAGHP